MRNLLLFLNINGGRNGYDLEREVGHRLGRLRWLLTRKLKMAIG